MPSALAVFGVNEGVGTNIKCLRAAIERLEGGRDILRPPDFECSDVGLAVDGAPITQNADWLPAIEQFGAPSAPPASTSRFHRVAAYTQCLRCAGAPRLLLWHGE
jgi:hypothetical protein